MIVYSQFFNLQWTPLILFVFLACIIEQTRIGTDLFTTASKWLSRLPGGLLIASIGAEAGMAACIGSSSTTALAVGQVAIPEMTKLGYDRTVSIGAILSGGVLGPLIPPSVPMIVYALMSRQSIGELFVAGVVPGILIAGMLCITAVVLAKLRPSIAPRPPSATWRARFASLKLVWPVIVVIGSILGGVYFGIMTANEAAGVACVVILIIAVAFYNFRWKNLMQAALNTTVLAGMICLMVIAAYMLTYVVATSGMAQTFTDALLESGLSRWNIVIMINLLLLFLGCFIDGLTIILLMVPFFVTLISGMGFSLVWFGVLMVVNNEIGLITPPMGINLFIVRAAFDVPIGALLKAVLPFLIALLLGLAILTAFPAISTWLPGLIRGG
jgi:C4-dicarboxylate transporter DctM subunit